MITANALICGKKIQLIVIKIMSLGYIKIRQLHNYTITQSRVQGCTGSAQG
ncbi:hypothetical protein [Symbiopectobacterium sp. RP]|uniref:hypothetical protein n=1 Tax=Symbiopectobacterium sp. RP TaxID=3248553 RepID=UPI003D27253F